MIRFLIVLLASVIPSSGYTVPRCSGINVSIQTLPMVPAPSHLACHTYDEGNQLHVEFLYDHLSLLRHGISQNLDAFISRADGYRIDPKSPFASVILKINFSEEILKSNIRYVSFEPSVVLSGLRRSIDLRDQTEELEKRDFYLLSFIHFFEYCSAFSNQSALFAFTAQNPTQIEAECLLLSSKDIYDTIWKEIE